jgi:hypothetical protein
MHQYNNLILKQHKQIGQIITHLFCFQITQLCSPICITTQYYKMIW